jgi:steroid 5-alpha reductase family enzyme
MKNNRVISFLIILFIYLFASFIGIFLSIYLPFNIYTNILLADISATILVFIFSLIFKNASVYDPYWSVQPMVIVVSLLVTHEITIPRVLGAIGVCAWGIRLTANWAYTFGSLNHQDWRYTMLKEKTKLFYPVVNFIGIHMVPTLVVFLCCLPLIYLFENSNYSNVGTIIFFVGSILSMILQGVADIQMHKYQKNRTMPFIRDGLWKYSRHPNYLAEILMWWNIGLLCVTSLHGYWYILIGAVANTMLFMFVSIPLADGKQSKKDGFLEYKKATRMLLPIKK